jgi:Ca2+-binding RTX toxin-like protein
LERLGRHSRTSPEVDIAEVNGGNDAEDFTVTANGDRVQFDRLDPDPFSIDIGTTENLVLNMNGGNDSFSATGNLASLIKLTVDGGADDDSILGSNGIDFLLGGDGDDFIDGQQGNDVARLGAGDDTFQWDPGDGSDVVEGQDGFDTLLFNGANIGEKFEISANGERVFFTRDIATINMDLNDVESIDVNALRGTDQITVNDLSGTDVTEVNFDLASTLGGSAGDNEPDTTIIKGTNSTDVIEVTVDNEGAVTIQGLAAKVTIENFDDTIPTDQLTINALGGDDVVDASTLSPGILLTANGGDGDDFLRGGAGDDVLRGEEGDDVLIGLLGVDLLDGGPGDNILIQ